MRVFVYGTLRRGGRNHHLLASSRFLTGARTEPAFELVEMGGYPAMVPGGGTRVVGEVFEVNLPTLARLDLLEEVPEFYRRVELAMQGLSAMAYVLPRRFVDGRARITSGDYGSFLNRAGDGS